MTFLFLSPSAVRFTESCQEKPGNGQPGNVGMSGGPIPPPGAKLDTEMILIESKTNRVFVNERETTCVFYDRQEKVAYINYINTTPRRVPDVISMSFVNDAQPCALTFDGKEL